MRPGVWFLLLALLAAGVFLLLNAVRSGDGTRSARAPRVPRSAAAGEEGSEPGAGRIERRLRELASRIDRLEEDFDRLRGAVRASFRVPEAEGEGADPDAFLDRFVRSFEDNASGSEYYRLAVDAHAPLLVGRLAALLADASQPAALRARIARILGTERFRGDPAVTAALLGVLGPDTPPDLAAPVLGALALLGDATALPVLERYADAVPWSNLPYEIYETVVAVAGDERNAALQRWLPRARDALSQSIVFDRIDRADADGALGVFREAWRLDEQVRAAAARRLGGYRTDPFRSFVEEKLAVEPDPVVRKALERAREQQGKIPAYDAMQAAGPPDADPNLDHPKAWAPAGAEMGIQWIELGYAPARRASLLRIHEVNSAGAVIEAEAVDEEGGRHSLWRGSDPTARPGVFELSFPLTAYRIRRIRLVLDTNRRPGWNEIDAVELVGPEGRAWAASAVASSSYGQ